MTGCLLYCHIMMFLWRYVIGRCINNLYRIVSGQTFTVTVRFVLFAVQNSYFLSEWNSTNRVKQVAFHGCTEAFIMFMIKSHKLATFSRLQPSIHDMFVQFWEFGESSLEHVQSILRFKEREIEDKNSEMVFREAHCVFDVISPEKQLCFIFSLRAKHQREH